jgi:ABC-2 type transport system permease protein
MVIFVELFGGAIHTGTRYVTYVVPGVLVLCAGFGSTLTAVAVATDFGRAMVDRLRAMDVPAPSLLAGHVAASVSRNVGSGVLVFGVAILLGFRGHTDVPHALAAVGLLLAFVIAISWLAATLGVLASSPEAANGVTFVIMFLPYASSAFVPVHTMPGWLHGFAAHQPITPLTDAVRGFLLGTPVGSAAWFALAWCAGILALSLAGSVLAVARRSRP